MSTRGRQQRPEEATAGYKDGYQQAANQVVAWDSGKASAWASHAESFAYADYSAYGTNYAYQAEWALYYGEWYDSYAQQDVTACMG